VSPHAEMDLRIVQAIADEERSNGQR
jgi:hypothetical protein